MTKQYLFPCGCRFNILKESQDEGVLPLMDIDIENVPEDCPATFALLGTGATKGIFQLESSLGKTWSKKLGPENLEHMAALGALLRPGCLRAVDENNVSMTQHFVRRKNGVEETIGYHPAIDAILFPTYNVLCYQEQAMFIASAIAGFNQMEADMLRKAIGKKLPAEMAKCKKMFAEGIARENIVTKEQGDEIFGWIEKSQRYSFNKSHAYCYGVRGYKTAYIKAHFPLAFFTAWLRNACHKQDPATEVRELVNDAKLFDIDVKVPDFRSVKKRFHRSGKHIIFGIADIKGIGDSQVNKIKATIQETEERLGRKIGDLDWFEFLTQVSEFVASGVMASIIESGGLDWMRIERQIMLNELKTWLELTAKEREWIRDRVSIRNFTKLVQAMEALGEDKATKEQKPKRLAEIAKEMNQLKKKLYGACLGMNENEEHVYELDEPDPKVQAQIDMLQTEKARINLKLPGGGCSNKNRVSIVNSAVQLLKNPPTVITDTPHWIAWAEDKNLGISITCSKIDGCDLSQVNMTCKDFINGGAGQFIMLGVEIDSVREVKTKKGKNPGQKMAFLSVSDSSCALEDVVCFPDVYREFKDLLTVNNTVIIQGEKDSKKGSTSLFVKKVWQAD